MDMDRNYSAAMARRCGRRMPVAVRTRCKTWSGRSFVCVVPGPCECDMMWICGEFHSAMVSFRVLLLVLVHPQSRLLVGNVRDFGYRQFRLPLRASRGIDIHACVSAENLFHPRFERVSIRNACRFNLVARPRVNLLSVYADEFLFAVHATACPADFQHDCLLV